MADANQVILGCSVVTVPEAKTVGKTNLTRFRVAWNKKKKNAQTQEWEEEKSYFTVIAWSELGIRAEQLSVGTRILLTGQLRQREWQDSEGNKRSEVEINAANIGAFLPEAQTKLISEEQPSGEDLDWLKEG